MEGLGVGSRDVLLPFLAAYTCTNRDRIALMLRDASRETRTDRFEFMSEVCLSPATARRYFLDSSRDTLHKPRATMVAAEGLS